MLSNEVKKVDASRANLKAIGASPGSIPGPIKAIFKQSKCEE